MQQAKVRKGMDDCRDDDSGASTNDTKRRPTQKRKQREREKKEAAGASESVNDGHPLLAVPRQSACPRSCPRPLGTHAFADQLLLHALEHRSCKALFKNGIRLSKPDQNACLQYILVDLSERSSEPEKTIWLLSMIPFVSSWMFGGPQLYPRLVPMEDRVQSAIVQILSKLTTYDSDRAGAVTWLSFTIASAAAELLGASGVGVHLNKDTSKGVRKVSRALYDGQLDSFTAEDVAVVASRVLGLGVSRKRAEALLRLIDGFVYTGELDPAQMENAVPILSVKETSTRSEWDDEEILDLISRDTVRGVLSKLTWRQRARFAAIIGLDRRSPQLQREIRDQLGIREKNLLKSLNRGRRTVKNRAAAAQFGRATLADAENNRRLRQPRPR